MTCVQKIYSYVVRGGLGAPGTPKFQPLYLGKVCRPKNFEQIYNNLNVYFKRIRKNKNFTNFFIICSKFSLNFQNSLKFSIIFAKFLNYFQNIVLTYQFYNFQFIEIKKLFFIYPLFVLRQYKMFLILQKFLNFSRYKLKQFKL